MTDSEKEEADVVVPPPREEPGKKFFLSHANTYEGMALFKELYNKDDCVEPEWAAHSFVGTVNKTEKTPHGAF